MLVTHPVCLPTPMLVCNIDPSIPHMSTLLQIPCSFGSVQILDTVQLTMTAFVCTPESTLVHPASTLAQIPCGFGSVQILDTVQLTVTAFVCDPADFYPLTQAGSVRKP